MLNFFFTLSSEREVSFPLDWDGKCIYFFENTKNIGVIIVIS